MQIEDLKQSIEEVETELKEETRSESMFLQIHAEMQELTQKEKENQVCCTVIVVPCPVCEICL